MALSAAMKSLLALMDKNVAWTLTIKIIIIVLMNAVVARGENFVAKTISAREA